MHTQKFTEAIARHNHLDNMRKMRSCVICPTTSWHEIATALMMITMILRLAAFECAVLPSTLLPRQRQIMPSCAQLGAMIVPSPLSEFSVLLYSAETLCNSTISAVVDLSFFAGGPSPRFPSPSFPAYPPLLALPPVPLSRNPARGSGKHCKLPQRGPPLKHFYPFSTEKDCI